MPPPGQPLCGGWHHHCLGLAAPTNRTPSSASSPGSSCSPATVASPGRRTTAGSLLAASSAISLWRPSASKTSRTSTGLRRREREFGSCRGHRPNDRCNSSRPPVNLSGHVEPGDKRCNEPDRTDVRRFCASRPTGFRINTADPPLKRTSHEVADNAERYPKQDGKLRRRGPGRSCSRQHRIGMHAHLSMMCNAPLPTTTNQSIAGRRYQTLTQSPDATPCRVGASTVNA